MPAPAAQQQTDPTIIEVKPGETIYFQLLTTAPADRSISLVRVQDPGRDHSVIRATLEPGGNGSAHALKLRNGYEFGLMFAVTGCGAAGNADQADGHTGSLMMGATPDQEIVVKIPASRTRFCLGSFTQIRPLRVPPSQNVADPR